MTQRLRWILDKHIETNHYYDQYLPYEFHLRMVKQAFDDFKHLLPKNMYTEPNTTTIHPPDYIKDITEDVIEYACWGHDLIEDTRTNYNECARELGVNVADIIYAVTNEKGKNRNERANSSYYNGIRNTPGASFVKLCDRIANIQYSKLTKSKMFDMYKKEYTHFANELFLVDYKEMTNYIYDLLNK